MSQSPAQSGVLTPEVAGFSTHPVDYAAFAHDLRSPLGGMVAMVTLLRQTALNAEQVRLVDALAGAVNHLHDLANQVLMPHSSEAALLPVSDVLTMLARSAEARARMRGLTFSLFAPDMTAINVEAGALRRVLENLIDNAMRLTQAGGVQLDVEKTAPDRLLFRLSDTGPGITREDAARLIEQGGQMAGRPGGAGMGLRLAGALVAERGGQLQGGSRLDGKPGAEFHFDWPFSTLVQALDAATTPIYPDAPRSAGSPVLPCLVVDDHPSARLILMTVLGALGVPCEEAPDVETAWRMVQLRRYRAVFTDLNMPDGGGQSLLDHLMSLPAGMRPVRIVVSADAGHAPGETVDASLQKPICVPAIQALVQQFELAQGGMP
jgi:two-component system, sensor histidine kinase